ncbi:MAG TPA: UDP-glucose/GDP-mannose dehydrogenase family protein [Nitrososphaerales archaeon]|nr:UDP-glucose/GDP-mannose dehydrogenase family protein [Nitrososphaerales archaeon]
MKQTSAKPRVAFVGLGYVGLSTAACFAKRGFVVHAVDVDKEKVERIQRGELPFHENGLESLLQSSLRNGSLNLSSTYDRVAESEIVFITVGTPSNSDGSIDTKFVEAASGEIGRRLSSVSKYRLVVVKSTVVPGTTETLVRPILERQSGKKVGNLLGLAANPEFLHEGLAIKETYDPDALVIGGHDKKASELLTRMYRSFYKRLPPTVTTTPSNAEMMKYAINGVRATQVSFVNMVADICSRVPGSDMDEVRKGLSLVAKLDERYLSAGLGFGGSCLPKDARALAAFAKSCSVDDSLISAALIFNERRARQAVMMAEGLGGPLAGKKVSVLGLAFKSGTDDVRESVSLSLTRILVESGARVFVHDPIAMENARLVLGGAVSYSETVEACLKDSYCCFVATGWPQYRGLRPHQVRTLMARPVIVDGRRVLKQRPFRNKGVLIATIGTGPTAQEPRN